MTMGIGTAWDLFSIALEASRQLYLKERVR